MGSRKANQSCAALGFGCFVLLGYVGGRSGRSFRLFTPCGFLYRLFCGGSFLLRGAGLFPRFLDLITDQAQRSLDDVRAAVLRDFFGSLKEGLRDCPVPRGARDAGSLAIGGLLLLVGETVNHCAP